MFKKDDPLLFHFNALTWCGFWRINSQVRWKLEMYKVYKVVSMAWFTLSYVLALIDLFKVRNDVEKFASNLCASSAATAAIFKLYVVHFNVEKLEKLRYLFKNNMGMTYIRQSSKDRINLENSSIEIFRTTKLFSLITLPVLFIWVLFPIIESSKNEKILPYRMWFPLPLDESPIFEIIYTFEILALCFYFFYIVSIEPLIYGLYIQICAQFEILASNVKKITETHGEKEEGEGGGRKQSQQRQDQQQEQERFPGCQDCEKRKKYDVQDKLKDCVRHHQAILRAADEVESIFCWAMLVQIACIAVLICVISFDILINSPHLNSQMYRQMIYVVSVMSNFLFHCYYGTRLERRSLELSDAVFGSAWYNLDIKSKKILTILLIRAQKPPRLTSGKRFQLNLPTFLDVVSFSYNMLAVLRRTSNR